MNPNIEEYIHKTLRELEPYLGDIIIVGGICSAFYHELKKRQIPEGLYSLDLDVGVPRDGVRINKPSITECLTKAELRVKEVPYYRNIFITKFVPDHKPERKNQSGELFEVEFLLPLTGSDEKPTDRVGTIQGEIVSQKLRYLDLALYRPINPTIKLMEGSFDVLLPNPGNFIIHKLLSSEKRSEFKKEKKDYGYVLNTLDLFGTDEDLEIMVKAVHETHRHSEEWAAWIKKALKKLKTGFLGKNNDLLEYGLDTNPMASREYAIDLVRKFHERCSKTVLNENFNPNS